MVNLEIFCNRQVLRYYCQIHICIWSRVYKQQEYTAVYECELICLMLYIGLLLDLQTNLSFVRPICLEFTQYVRSTILMRAHEDSAPRSHFLMQKLQNVYTAVSPTRPVRV